MSQNDYPNILPTYWRRSEYQQALTTLCEHTDFCVQCRKARAVGDLRVEPICDYGETLAQACRDLGAKLEAQS